MIRGSISVALCYILLSYPCGAVAGYYSVNIDQSYQGMVYVTSTGGGGWQKIYSWLVDGNYGGGALSSATEGGPITTGSVTCDGEVRVRFHWENGGNLADPAPKVVAIKKRSYAGWDGTSGICSDGFGDPMVANYGGATSSGTRYEVLSNVGPDFYVSFSPHAYAYTPAPTELSLSASASISIGVEVTPVTLNLTGVTPWKSKDYIMIGQGCGANLSCPGYSFNGYDWSIPGTTFKQYSITPSQDSGMIIHLNSTDLTNASPHWFWHESASSPETVSVAANLVAADGTVVGTVPINRQVTVMIPGQITSNTLSLIDANYDSSLTTSVFAGEMHDSSSYGIQIQGRAATPNHMGIAGDFGITKWGQLCKLIREGFSGSVHHYDFLLDNAWTYPGGHSDGNASPTRLTWAFLEDGPEQGLGGSTNYHIEDNFNSYLMYLPPGPDSCLVSLRKCSWGWLADGTRANWFVAYSPDPPIGFMIDGHSNWYTNPEWTEKYANGL